MVIGTALNFFGELEACRPPPPDWNTWSAAYLAKFPDNRQIDIKYKQLVAQTQCPGESVTVFAADVHRLAKRAFPQWNGAGENDIIIKNHRINRLLPEIRRWVQNSEPDSFEAAVTEAEKQELRERQYEGETSQSHLALTTSVNQLVQQLSTLNISGNPFRERGSGQVVVRSVPAPSWHRPSDRRNQSGTENRSVQNRTDPRNCNDYDFHEENSNAGLWFLSVWLDGPSEIDPPSAFVSGGTGSEIGDTATIAAHEGADIAPDEVSESDQELSTDEIFKSESESEAETLFQSKPGPGQPELNEPIDDTFFGARTWTGQSSNFRNLAPRPDQAPGHLFGRHRVEQKTAGSQQVMSNQKSNAQHPSLTLSDEIPQLQSEMARLMAHIAGLTNQQQAPAPRNLTPPIQPLVHIQNTGDHLSGAHLQICSFQECCTDNEASCRAQGPNSTGPCNAPAHTSRCYCC
uniref:Retrotransposon gag domain-containing protein n=1 Tax=Romanomermis culicivorax TaxID=13658 RepID=A0A915JC97_ROMCU